MDEAFTDWLNATAQSGTRKLILNNIGTVRRKCDGNAEAQECLDRLMAVLDGEATEEDRAKFKANIPLCRACFETFFTHRIIKGKLAGVENELVYHNDKMEALRSKLSELP